jgi:uncharacterized protein
MDIVRRFLQKPSESFFLFGPRGSGKSTWLKQSCTDALYLDLLSPDLFRELAARPERLAERVRGEKKKIVMIDEIQKIPELLPVIHQMIEKKEGWQFILTGSSARKLKRFGINLLGGRAVLRSMHPFMGAELGPRFDLGDALHQGMLPVVLGADVPSDILKTYAALYMKEEVQQEGLVRNIGSFARFLEAVSFSHGALLNSSEVARECQVGRKAVEGYLEILEDLLLSFRIPVFSKRAKRLVIQHPKFYYFDAGVFRTLRPSGPLDRPEEIDGAALEGLVAQHLRAFCDLDGRGFSLSFWRTKAGMEVDFILYGAGGIIAIEVKRTSRLREADLSGLKAFKSDYPMAKTMLLYGGKERLLMGDVHCVPCEDFLRILRPEMDWEKDV